VLFALALCALGSGASAASAAPPTISVEGPVEIGVSTARGHGKITPGGKETFYRFEYVSDQQFDENEANNLPGFEGAASAFGALEASAGETAIEPVFEGLVSGTEYHLRLVAENEDGTEVAAAPTFMTQSATAPALTIKPAIDVSFTKARISGTIDPEGGNENPIGGTVAIGWELQLSTSPGDGFFGVASGAIEGADAQAGDPVAIPADPEGFLAEGLANNTTYYLRLVAYYAGRQEISAEQSFTTDLVTAPLVETDDASAVTGTTAHFSGEVTPGNADAAFNANCAFDYVADAQFQLDQFASAQSIECTPALVEGANGVEVLADSIDLIPHTVYHLRLRAGNQGATATDEATNTFETESIAPLLQGTSVSDVTTSSATLHAEVNPGGAATRYHFEYLTLDAFEKASGSFAGASKTPESPSIGSDSTYHPAEAEITGLAEDTAYRFRVVATNEKSPPGGSAGPVRSLRTLAQPSSNPDSCPNAAVRAHQDSNFLPDCRAYELVNPPSRDYGDVMRMPPVGDDGTWTGFTNMAAGDDALGAQVGSNMLAHRNADGWETVDSNAVAKPFRGKESSTPTFPIKYSADRTRALVMSDVRLDPADNDSVDLYLLDVGQGSTHWITHGSMRSPGNSEHRLAGTSEDLSRIVFYTSNQLLPEAQPNLDQQIYLREGDALSLVSVLPNGDPAYGQPPSLVVDRGFVDADSGVGSVVAHGGARSVSDDAKRIYFFTNPGGGVLPKVLYVRDLAATPEGRTVAVTASERTGDGGNPLQPFEFIGASADGSVAYFSSTAQLTDEATPGGGIYRFELNAPVGNRLTQITPDNGDPVNAFGDHIGLGLNSGILSADASHIYFTTRAMLTPEATDGLTNAYVTSHGDTEFIGSFEESASVERVSRDGSFALITSSSSANGAPNNGLLAIYEYNARSGGLTCASCRPDGARSESSASLGKVPDAPLPALNQPRNIADDGTVFFSTRDRILAADQNEVDDVYQYRDGKVSLLTTGRSDRPAYLVDNSDDGSTAFIMSAEPFVGVDRDANELDAYAVRVDGGFLEAPPPAARCEGEACRGQASTPPTGSGSASETLVAPTSSSKCAGGKTRRNGRCVKKSRKHHGKHHRKHHKRHAQGKGRTRR
jgi:hypothetical protein